MSKFKLFGGQEKGSANQWLKEGQAAYRQGQYETALEKLDKALRLDPELAQTRYLKAHSLGELGREREAIREWTAYLMLKPDDVRAWIAKANAHFHLRTSLGQAEALRCINRALQLDPDNSQLKLLKRVFQGDESLLDEPAFIQEGVEIYNKKAMSSLEAGQPEEALNYAEQALLIDPKSLRALNNKAVALLQLGRLHKALSFLDQAIVLEPTVETLWFNKAGVLEELNRSAEALQAYDKVLELNPRSEKTWKNKGLLLNRLGRNEEALPCFDALIELNPNNDDAWYNKGVLLANLGYPEFMDCFLRALRINPQNEAVRKLFNDLEQGR